MSENSPSAALGPLAALLAEITRAPPLPQLLEQTLDAACRLAHADTGVIGLYDATADVMRTTASHQSVQAHVPRVYKRGEGVGGRILQKAETFIGRYGDLHNPVVGAIADHQVMGLPIRWQEQLLGYFAVSMAPPRKFRAAQIEILELIARIAAIAIEHSRRQEEARRRSSRFELIARIAADIHREPDLYALLQRAADAIHSMLKFPNVDIPLVDTADPKTLVVRIRGGTYKRKILNEDRLLIGGGGIMGAAVLERQTQLVNDVRSDPRYLCPPGVTPALAELAVPICLGDRVLGVLNVEGNRTFDELDRRSLEVIADYLAVAIENFRLSEQASETAVLAERQRLARDLHDNVTQILSSMSLLSQTLTATWQRSPEEGEKRVARLQQLAQTAFAELRMLLRQLAPAETTAPAISRQSRSLVGLENLRTQALPGALTKLLANMVPDAVAVKTNFSGYVPQSLESEEALYRVCQEAVSNTIRHAGAKRLRIEAAVSERECVLRIADDGRGLGNEFRPGVGLGSMRTRVEILRGHFRIAPNTPHGTVVEARMPRADREVALSRPD
jgi:signal transduction histidine kinase